MGLGATRARRVASLRQAAESCHETLRRNKEAREPIREAEVTEVLGAAPLRLGVVTRDAQALWEGVEARGTALEDHAVDASPRRRATILGDLGDMLSGFADVSPDAEVLKAAEWSYRCAIDPRVRDATPLEWGAIQVKLARLLSASFDPATGDASALRDAKAALRAALEVFARDRHPAEWAMVQDELGAVLRKLGNLVGDVEMLVRAAELHVAVLGTITPEGMADQWASAQEHLGNSSSRSRT